VRGGPPFEKARALLDLARFPNLRLKVTTHVLRVADKDPAGPAALVDHLARHFGADRLLWGSDYSQTHDRSYADMVALARLAAASLRADERERFLGGTALELWPELATPRP
jgi:predicted TIM-barrel fold metal-dependent hydrolase